MSGYETEPGHSPAAVVHAGPRTLTLLFGSVRDHSFGSLEEGADQTRVRVRVKQSQAASPITGLKRDNKLTYSGRSV